VPVSERRHDRGLGPGHAIREQRQHVGRDPLDRGVEVGGGREARQLAGGHAEALLTPPASVSASTKSKSFDHVPEHHQTEVPDGAGRE
jgi:hypothetical protein